jgi:hypothetical protein
MYVILLPIATEEPTVDFIDAGVQNLESVVRFGKYGFESSDFLLESNQTGHLGFRRTLDLHRMIITTLVTQSKSTPNMLNK